MSGIRQRIEDYTDTDCPVPTGILMAIGGAEDKGQPIEDGDPKTKLENYVKLDVIKTFCDLTGKQNPRIEIVSTASTLPKEVEKDYRGVFKKIGCTNLGFIHDQDRSTSLLSPFLDRLRKADAVYFSGGNQLRLTSIYGGTEFLSVLKERYVRDKLVIAGTSAGAMAMSTPMIYHSTGEADILKGEVNMAIGLEFIKDVAIDTHFIQRGRFVRMAHVLASNPTSIGIGVEEDTAVIIRRGREVEVVGNGAVVIMDGHASTKSNIADVHQEEAVSVQNLMVHLLVKGDRYNIPIYNLQHK